MFKFMFANAVQKLVSAFIIYTCPFYFGAEVMGIYAQFMSFLTIFVVMCSGSIEALIGRLVTENDNEKINFAINILYALSFFSLIIIPIFFHYANFISFQSEYLIALLAVATFTTSIGKTHFRAIRFKSKRLASRFIGFRVITGLALLLIGIVLNAPDTIIWIAAFSYLVSNVYSFKVLNIGVTLKSFYAIRQHTLLLKELIFLYPNRIFGMTAIPAVTILIGNNIGSDESGIFFLVLSILNALIFFFSPLSEEIQKEIYRGNNFHLESIKTKNWLRLLFILIFLSLSGYILKQNEDLFEYFNSYWQEVFYITVFGLSYVFISLLKVIHIGLYFSDRTTSKYLIVSTILFWVFCISGVGYINDIQEGISLIIYSRFLANVLALLIYAYLTKRHYSILAYLSVLNSLALIII